MGCETGDAVVSHAHNLTRSRYIVHLVAPYLDERGHVQTALYARALCAALACIDGVRVRSLAIAVFGTAFYGCPHIVAAAITIRVLREWLGQPANAGRCDRVWVCPPTGGEAHFDALWPRVFGTGGDGAGVKRSDDNM